MYEVKLYFSEEEIKEQIEECRKKFLDTSIKEELPLIVDDYVDWILYKIKERWYGSEGTQQMDKIFQEVVDKNNYV